MTDMEAVIGAEMERMLPLPRGNRADWQDVLRRAEAARGRGNELSRRPRLTKRRVLALAVIAVVLAIPPLAFSGVLDSLFGLSNHGTPVPHESLRTLDALHVTGARPGTLVQLAHREGIGVYAAVRKRGLSRITPSNRRFFSHLCFYYGPSPAHSSGGCVKPRGTSPSGDFPSASDPVWDMSSVAAGHTIPIVPVASSPTVRPLVGVAADGVRSVQLLAPNCHAVFTTPVIDNVYIAADTPLVREAFIVARDARGKAVWHVRLWPDGRSCGLH